MGVRENFSPKPFREIREDIEVFVGDGYFRHEEPKANVFAPFALEPITPQPDPPRGAGFCWAFLATVAVWVAVGALVRFVYR